MIKKVEYKKHSIELDFDFDPVNPRSYDNLGKLYCFHKRYDLGDSHELKSDDFESWDHFQSFLVNTFDAILILPVYLYDHSGLRIKIGSFQGLLPQGHAEWDSGQVGFVLASHSDVCKEYKVNRVSDDLLKKVEKVLHSEIDQYDNYLSGQIFSYVSYDSEGEVIDSCCGYDDLDYAIECAKEEIDFQIVKIGEQQELPV